MNDDFYHSKAWKDCRTEYYNSVNGLCERCLKRGIYRPGVIVHHKTYITASNKNDPNITLNRDNLELLCKECHNKEHKGHREESRIMFDEEGNVLPVDPPV